MAGALAKIDMGTGLPSQAAIAATRTLNNNKGSAAAKTAGAMGLLSAILSPLLVVFGNYASYRMSMDEAETDEERGHVKRLFKNSLLVALAISAALAVPLFWILRGFPDK